MNFRNKILKLANPRFDGFLNDTCQSLKIYEIRNTRFVVYVYQTDVWTRVLVRNVYWHDCNTLCVRLNKCKFTLPFECEIKWQEGRKYGLPYGHVFVQWSAVIQSKIRRIEVDFGGYIRIYRDSITWWKSIWDTFTRTRTIRIYEGWCYRSLLMKLCWFGGGVGDTWLPCSSGKLHEM